MLRLTPGFLRFYGPVASQALQLYRELYDHVTLPHEIKRQGQGYAQANLLRHAYRYSSFWRQRLSRTGFDVGAPEQFELTHLPVLTRQDLQESFEAMRARWPSCAADKIFTVATSGSTGEPVRVEKYHDFYHPLDQALALLEMDWFSRDPSQTFANLGPNLSDRVAHSWGGIYEALGFRGQYHQRNFSDKTLASHLDWLNEVKPSYLKCSPYFAAALATQAQEMNRVLSVEQIISVSEGVSPQQRAICQQGLGAKIIDRYSSEETGMIALQCPSHDHLHVIDTAVIVEIVDPAGKPSPIGEVGRLLVTALYSFAMPIIRYDLGDLAEWGLCDRGQTMPVIKRVWGRTRCGIAVPERGVIPMGFIGDDLGKIEAIREFRLRQYPDAQLELELVTKRPLTEQEEAEIIDLFRGYGLSGLTLYLSEKPQIEWPPLQKREEFVRVNNSPVAPLSGKPTHL